MKQSNGSPQIQPIICGINGSISVQKASSVFKNMCPLIVIFLQFSITSMFMWMLCEGIHLNNILTVNVFKHNFKTYYFYILGWSKIDNYFDYLFFTYVSFFVPLVVPFCITLSWSIIMFIKERGRK